MAVKIITDSTSDIPLSQAEALGIRILPLRVLFGEEEYIDGVTLTAGEFYEKLKKSDTLPHTSQITPAEFHKVFEQETADGSQVLGIFISGELSGTFQSALLAAQDYSNVYLVDSRLVTFALGALVRIAVGLRERGLDAARIAQELEQLKSRVVLSAVIGDISYLVKGGRLSNAGGVLAAALNIKPLITMKNGLVLPSGAARGMKKGYRSILQRMLKDGVDTRYPLVFGHSNLPEGAAQLRELVAQVMDPGDIEPQLIGTVVGTHAGPGAAGVVYVRKA
jgi:DegV family protein with EDD domain